MVECLELIEGRLGHGGVALELRDGFSRHKRTYHLEVGMMNLRSGLNDGEFFN
jgi:hypothetical protein